MTKTEFAEILERFARDVEQIPGVSRTKPHAFAEAKSEVAGDMRRFASQLRTVTLPAAIKPVIEPGTRCIGGRRILVETR